MIPLEEAEGFCRNLSALVVEDDPAVQFQTKSFLGRLFTTVETADDGKQGLEKFGEHRYDLVVTDIQMPGMDGLEMVAKIRETAPEVVVVILSAHHEEEFLLRAIEMGVVYYARKPLEMAKFLETIRESMEKVVRKRESERLTRLLDTAINLQREMVIVTDGKEIRYANRRFKEFFLWEGHDPSTNGASDFHIFLVKVDGRFYDHEVTGWVDYLLDVPDGEHVVLFHDIRENEGRAFLAQASRVEETGEYVISFTDVSGLAEHAMELETRLYVDRDTRIRNMLGMKIALERTLMGKERYGQILLIRAREGEPLRKQADRLKELLPLEDLPGRWEDRYFMILSENGPATCAALADRFFCGYAPITPDLPLEEIVARAKTSLEERG